MTCSFQDKHASMYKMVYLKERDCNACLKPYLTNHISHAALTKKMNIFDSRAVILYLECPYTISSFQFMQIGKPLQCLFGTVTGHSYLTYMSNQENRCFQ